MRVAIVHSFYRSGPSGENTAVLMQANALSEAGHKVKVISRSTDNFMNKPGYALASGITVATGFGPSPLKEITEFDPDIVHVHNLFPNWGDRWVDQLGQPLVVTVHNFRPLCAAGTLSLEGAPCDLCPSKGSHHALKNKCYQGSAVRTIPLSLATARPETNRLINRADQLVFLHPEVQGSFVKHLPHLADKKAAVIPNFSGDVLDFDIPVPPKSLDRAWIFVGRLSPEKGILPLVKSWPSSERLQIVGGGPLDNDLRLAATGKQIEILGEVSPDVIPRLLDSAKGLVFPSVWLEQSPLSFIEALRAGLPILAKSGSVPAGFVIEHGCGAVFESFNDVPEEVLSLSQRLPEASTRARNLFDSTFTKKIWLSRMNTLFSDLLSKKSEVSE